MGICTGAAKGENGSDKRHQLNSSGGKTNSPRGGISGGKPHIGGIGW